MTVFIRSYVHNGAFYINLYFLTINTRILFHFFMFILKLLQVGVDMAHFPEFTTELQFVEQMVTEESVFCLPSKVITHLLPNNF